jgi:hypothetical protein
MSRKGETKVRTIVWKRFGKGWLGSTNQRIYDVTFKKGDGETMTATCKTSMFGGVFWTSEVLPAHSEKIVTGDK